MTCPEARRAVLMACAALLTNFYSVLAWGQAPPGTYEVRKGEGLLAISSRLSQYKGVTRFQIVAAIYRANDAQVLAGSRSSPAAKRPAEPAC